MRHKSSQFSAQKARYRAVGAGRHGGQIELVSKDLDHLAAILHVYAGGLNFMK